MAYTTSTQYFENLLEDYNEYSLDIAGSAVQMLEKAYHFACLAMDMFEMSQENKSDYYWHKSMEYNNRSRGFLDAYEILTNRFVPNVRSSIKLEIEYMKEVCEELFF